MGLYSLFAKIVGSRFFPLYWVYKLLKKLKIWEMIWIAVITGPSLLGSYYFLTSEGLHPLFALIGVIGTQFGGQIIEVWNALSTIPETNWIGAILLLSGSSLDILRLLTYFYVYDRLADASAPTVPDLVKYPVGAAFLLVCTAFAVFIDIYALPGTSQMSGWTYVLSNPDIVTQPLGQMVGQAASDPGAQEALNKTVNNSNLTG